MKSKAMEVMSMNSEAILKIRGMKTYFYTVEGVVKAVDRISLDIGRSETFGLVGESGCGKSTVALSIMRLVPNPGRIVGGQILFEDEDLLKKSEEEMRKIRGDKISMIFQNPLSSLNPVFTVGSQVGEAIQLHQEVDRIGLGKKVVEILEKVRIPDPTTVARHYPHEYSGGMRQRAMTAIALSCRPKLLIADEPTTALDVTIQAQILELMKELRKELGLSIMLITHELGLVAELCERAAIMYAGKIVESGDVTTLFKRPRHPYTFALMKSVPGLEAIVKRFHVIKGNVPSLIDPPSGCRFHPRCDYAFDECVAEEPELREIESGHLVACIRSEELELQGK